MERYKVSGYTPPQGVNTAAQVKSYQRMLKVDDDGVWGPKTQAAYDAWSGAVGRKPKNEPVRYTAPMNAKEPDQIKTWQRIVGAKDDGIWGPKSQTAYEQWKARDAAYANTQRVTTPKGSGFILSEAERERRTGEKQSDYTPYRRDEGPKEPFYKPYGWVESTPAPAYTPPPLGIRTKDQIRTMQGLIGAEQDGVWGPESHAAYEAWAAKLHGSDIGSDAYVERAERGPDSGAAPQTPAFEPRWKQETGNYDIQGDDIRYSLPVAQVQRELNEKGITGSDGKPLEVNGILDEKTTRAMDASGFFDAKTAVYEGKDAVNRIFELGAKLGLDAIGIGAVVTTIASGNIPALIKLGLSGGLGWTVGGTVYDLSLFISAVTMYCENGNFTMTDRWRIDGEGAGLLNNIITFSTIQP